MVITAIAGMVGLLVLYSYIRRTVIPYFVPGVAFRTVGARVAGRVVLTKAMK